MLQCVMLRWTPSWIKTRQMWKAAPCTSLCFPVTSVLNSSSNQVRPYVCARSHARVHTLTCAPDETETWLNYFSFALPAHLSNVICLTIATPTRLSGVSCLATSTWPFYSYPFIVAQSAYWSCPFSHAHLSLWSPSLSHTHSALRTIRIALIGFMR